MMPGAAMIVIAETCQYAGCDDASTRTLAFPATTSHALFVAAYCDRHATQVTAEMDGRPVTILSVGPDAAR